MTYSGKWMSFVSKLSSWVIKLVFPTSRHGDSERVEERSSGFRVKKTSSKVKLQVDVKCSYDSSSRWVVITRPWIIQIWSWGTVTTRYFLDFTQNTSQHCTTLTNSAQNVNGFAQSSYWTCVLVLAQLWTTKSHVLSSKQCQYNYVFTPSEVQLHFQVLWSTWRTWTCSEHTLGMSVHEFSLFSFN